MVAPKDDKRLTAKIIRNLLNYDPKTGIFTWRVRSSNRLRAGDKAGSIGKFRYARICIDHRSFSAHRLAWLHYHGEWPKGHLDHINGNCADNRIENLRLATSSQNSWNMKAMKNNATGMKGITRDRGKWKAHICCHYKRYNLGLFNTPEEAHQAYIKAAKKLHKEFARY